MKALAASDPSRFLETLSGLEPDRQWSVRAAVAESLRSLPVETAAPLLEAMAADQDQRVAPAVLETLTTLKAPRAVAIAYDTLKSPDPVVRAAAAHAIGELKPDGAADVLKQAAGVRRPRLDVRRTRGSVDGAGGFRAPGRRRPPDDGARRPRLGDAAEGRGAAAEARSIEERRREDPSGADAL